MNWKINVKDYGALGDGIKDDRHAVQNALDACKAITDQSGVTNLPVLWFPAGAYRIVVDSDDAEFSGNPPTGTLTVDCNLSIEGDGREVSRLYFEPRTYPEYPQYPYHGLIINRGHDFKAKGIGIWCKTPVTDQHLAPRPPDSSPSDDGITEYGPNVGILCEGPTGDVSVEHCTFDGPNGGWGICIFRMSGDGELNVAFNEFNTNCVGLAAYCGGTNWRNIKVPTKIDDHDRPIPYDVTVHSHFNKYHSWRHNHSLYRHGSVSLRSVGDYHGPSGHYPTARPLSAYYTAGQAPETDARSPKFVDIVGATIVGDKDYAIRQHQARVVEAVDSWLAAKPITQTPQSMACDGVLSVSGTDTEPMRVVVERSGASLDGDAVVVVYGYEATAYPPGPVQSEQIAVGGSGARFYGKMKWQRVTHIDLPAGLSKAGTISVGNADGPLRVWNIASCTFLGCGKVLEAKGPFNMVGCVADSYGELPTTQGIEFNSNSSFTDAVIAGCTFRTAGCVISVNHAGVVHGGRIQLSGCTFERLTGDQAGNGWAIISNEASSVHTKDVKLVFSQCTFYAPGEHTYGMLSNNSATFDGCEFRGGFLNKIFATTTVGSVGARRPVWTFNACVAEDGIQVVGMGGAGRLQMTLRGHQNRFWREADTMTIAAYPNGIGEMTPTPGLASHKIEPVSDDKGVWSLVPQGWAADTFEVSGNKAITRINFDGNNRCINGRIWLFGNEGWSTLGSGNIVPKTTIARAKERLYCFMYVKTMKKWIEL